MTPQPETLAPSTLNPKPSNQQSNQPTKQTNKQTNTQTTNKQPNPNPERRKQNARPKNEIVFKPVQQDVFAQVSVHPWSHSTHSHFR